MVVQVYLAKGSLRVYNGAALRETARTMLERAGVGPGWIVGIELARTARMRQLNYTYRRHNRSTDILSFPLTSTEEGKELQDSLRHASCSLCYEPPIGGSPLLGEIFICPEVVARRLRYPPVSRLRHRIRRLLAHGISHLLGHDHHTAIEYRRMHKLECHLLNRCRNDN